MSISIDHEEAFVPFEKNQYKSSELQEIFSRMDLLSNDYCSMRRKMKAYSKEDAVKLIDPRFLDRYFQSYPGSLQDLIAGCWNFFEMNDLRPDLDFYLVKKLYPDTKYDCYSVGFLQPYIMQSILSCDSLSMVDINWRILDVHRKFIQSFSASRNALSAIEEIVFNWFALDQKIQKPRNGSISILCREVQQKGCREYLENFNSNLYFPDKISFQLTHLFHTDFHKIKKNTIRVFFLSNAIEEAYTSSDEYRELLERTVQSLPVSGKAVFIHHVGGWKLFGLYEIKKITEKGEYELKTVCKDEYKSLLRSSTDEPVVYQTYFDRQSNDIAFPSCYEKL